MRLLYNTEDYQYLADELIKEDGNEFVCGGLERKIFPDGEKYLRITDHVKGSHCAILGGTQSNSNVLEIYDVASSLVEYGAKTLTIIIPYFGCSTMEKASKWGEIVTAKTRANLISSIPKAAYGNKIRLLELHNDAISYYFHDVSTYGISSKSVVMKACVEFAGTEFVLATTDVGRAKAVEYIQRAFYAKSRSYNIETAFVYKRRESGTDTEITGINADVKDRTVVIYDDMIRTGGSLIKAAKIYKDHGAKEVYAIATHGILPGSSIENLKASGVLTQIALTNSHPSAVKIAASHPDFIRLYSVAGLLSKFA